MSLSTKFRVVIDTNIFVSAFVWGGIPRQIISLWQKGNIIVLASPFLISEILTTLQRFDITKHELHRLSLRLGEHTVKVFPPRKVDTCRDEKDNQILDLCLAGKANFLVTGDKDRLVLKDFHSTQILKPQEFLRRF